MMASKKDLQADVNEYRRCRDAARQQLQVAHKEIKQRTFERDAAKRDAEGAWGRIQRDELRAHHQAKDAARVKRREERRKHLSDLAAGRLDVKNSTASAIVREDGETYVELKFPLDKDELPIVQRVLAGPEPTPDAPEVYLPRRHASTWDEVIENMRAAAHFAVPYRYTIGGPRIPRI